MRVHCPACHAELSLETILSHEAARQTVARLATVSVPFGALTLRYMALFRPEKRGLSIERMVRLLEELLPDIERRAIERKGRAWDAPPEAWRAAFEVVLGKRDKGTLTLPLTGHGLLYEVLAGLAEKQETREESEREQQRRRRGLEGTDRGPRNLADMAEALATAPGALAEPPQVKEPGPSRAVLQDRARIAAALERLKGPELTSGQNQEKAHEPDRDSPT